MVERATQEQEAIGLAPAEHSDKTASQERILELLWGYMSSDIVELALRLNIPEHLGDQGATANETAAATSTDPVAMLRFLRGFAALGLSDEPHAGHFTLTATGKRLRPDVPDSLHTFARQGSGAFRQAWAKLEHSIRTGEPAFDELFGTDFFDYLSEHPELSETFATSMREATRTVSTALAQHHNFSDCETVVDVGGADGSLLASILATHPHVRGIVFDSSAGSRDAWATLCEAGITDRCRVETGDFFNWVPQGGNLYILKSILHDWNDVRCQEILNSCRKAMPQHGRLLIAEVLLPGRVAEDAHPLTYLSDLYVLVNMGGRERSAADLEELLTATGFRVRQVLSPRAVAPFSLIEAEPEPDYDPEPYRNP